MPTVNEVKLQEKVLRTAPQGRRKRRLCLVIPLGQGARVQYPVRDWHEAQNIYNEFRQMNPHSHQLRPAP